MRVYVARPPAKGFDRASFHFEAALMPLEVWSLHPIDPFAFLVYLGRTPSPAAGVFFVQGLFNRAFAGTGRPANCWLYE